MPRPRPTAAISAQPPATTRSNAVQNSTAPVSATLCTDFLLAGIAVADIGNSVSGISGGAFCGDEAPVRLSAVRLTDGRTVELHPAAITRCEMALQFSHWVR